MKRTVRAAILTIVFALLTVTMARPALADARTEGVAKAALKKAEGDYLAMNYGTGAARIEKAMKACGQTKCGAPTRAALFRDLGTMQFRKGDKDQAARNWAEAVKLQPDIALNPSYDAPDLRKAFLAATKGNGGGGGGGDGGGGGGASSRAATSRTPRPTEQKVDTPLPIYVEGGGDSVVRVVVKYKAAGMTSWKRFDLKKVGDGWGGLVPCADVQSGTLRYYIQGLDDSKESVASNGDARHPYTVEIKDDISGDAPHLPGKAPPKSCHESSDCPPDFPGCSQERRSPPATTGTRTATRRATTRGARRRRAAPSSASGSGSPGRSTSSRCRREWTSATSIPSHRAARQQRERVLHQPRRHRLPLAIVARDSEQRARPRLGR